MGIGCFWHLGKAARNWQRRASLTPKISASPDGAPLGGTMVISDVGFAPFDTVNISWPSPMALIGTAVTDLNGSFVGNAAASVQIPTNVTVGEDYTLTAAGTSVPQAQAHVRETVN